MKTMKMVNLILMAGLLAPLLLLAAVAATAQERERTDDPAVAVDNFQASPPAVADLDRYAEREAASPDLAGFAGGHEEVVVVCSTCALVVLLLLILL
jgi:hypothetical protein